MKKIQLLFVLFSSVLMFFISCKPQFMQNEQGFEDLSKELTQKFGKDAYYTVINMSATGDETMGYSIFADVSKTAEELRQERWVLDGGSWSSAGFVNMQVQDRQAGFYKFQLDKEIKLSLLGKLIVSSQLQFTQDGFGDQPILKLAQVNTNNTVSDEAKKYLFTVQLAQKGSSETHSYTYDRNGNFVIKN